MTASRVLTTLVGSYPVPDWLVAAPSQQALRDATAVIFHLQELAGIDLLVDGELYRFDINHPETNGMIDYFIRPMAGIRTVLSRAERAEFRRQAGMAYRAEPAGIVTGPIGEGSLDLVRDFERARVLTTRPLKFTVTGPHMLSKVLLDRHYGDRAALAMALADVLAAQVAEIAADAIQIDEANLPGAPHEGEWAAAAINRVLAACRGEKAVHLCFGNYGGQVIQRGTWEALLPFFDALQADVLILEFAHRGYAELDCLRDLRREIGLGIGVIDIKSTVIETPEEIARRLEHAARVLGPERLRYAHPDCGFWMLKRSVVDAKIRALVRGRDLFEGRASDA